MKLVFLILALIASSNQLIYSQTTTTNDNEHQPVISPDWQFKEARQFDFWIGEWDVNLRAQQADASWKDWKQSKAKIYSILDGKAILELWEEQSKSIPANTIIGYSLRYYDTEIKKWVLWLNWPGVNRSGSSSLQGNFKHNRGEFFSSRPLNDSTSIISRYTFSDITPTSLRWDDGFSKDGGKTWTHSWIMEFSRTAKNPKKFSGNTIHTYRNGKRCTKEEFGVLDKLVGKWQGKVILEGHDWDAKEVKLDNYWALGGCSVMSFMEVDGNSEASHKEFALHTFNTYAKMYEAGVLDNSLSSKYKAYYGQFSEGKELILNKVNQTDGSVEATYSWTFTGENQLRIQKWDYKKGEKVKVFDSQLSRAEQ